jgi:hypothetical protein
VARKINSLHPKQANTLFPVAKAVSFMHPFFHKQRIWMQRPRIKGKILHPETKEPDVLVATGCECRKKPWGRDLQFRFQGL